MRMTAFLSAALAAGAGFCGDTVPVADAGFESAASGDTSAWSPAKARYRYVSGEGRNGSAAVRFDVEKGMPYSFPMQKISLEPGGRYRFEAWVRTKDVAGRGAGASLYAGWSDADGKHLGGGSAEGVKGTCDEWTLISVTMDVATNVASFTVGPYMTGSMTGTAWFDDVRITRLKRPVLGPLVSSAYRDEAAGGKVVFSCEPTAEFVRRGLSAVYAFKDGSGAIRKVKAGFDGDSLQAAVDVASLPLGESRVVLALLDKDGSVVESQRLRFNRLRAERKLPVRFDAGNRLIVDGRPFLPVGVYLSRYSQEAVADLKASPFNCVMSYQRLTREQMDEFHAAGIKVIYSIKEVYRGRPGCPAEITDAASEDAWVESHVRSLMDHPALLAWYVNDEMCDAWEERLRRRYELLRRTDPGHPVYAVLCQIGSLRRVLGTFDVIGTDPYPVGRKDPEPISMVADWTERTRRAVFGGKPVWQVPQIFDWGGYKTWKGFTTRAPTEAEMRNMAWQCVASGADGVVPYNYSGLKLREPAKRNPFEVQWAKVCCVYGEIRSHEKVLLSTEAPPAVGGAPRGVFARAWRHDGRDWILAVNTNGEAVECSLDVERRGSVAFRLEPLGVEMRTMD